MMPHATASAPHPALPSCSETCMLLFELSASAWRPPYMPLALTGHATAVVRLGQASPAALLGCQPEAQHTNQGWWCYLMCHTVCGMLDCLVRCPCSPSAPVRTPG